MNKITIDLLRHGDVAANKKLLGHSDELLSELGWQQCRSIIDDKTLPWNKIVSSPLQRCLAFSEEISSQFNLPLLIDSRFKEIDFGNWDGQQLADLYSGDEADQFIQFTQAPSSITPPDGEPFENFSSRVLSAWDELLTSLHNNQIQHCLLVTHGGVIRTIISSVLAMPNTHLSQLEVPHACLSRIVQYDDYPPVLSFHGGQLY